MFLQQLKYVIISDLESNIPVNYNRYFDEMEVSVDEYYHVLTELEDEGKIYAIYDEDKGSPFYGKPIGAKLNK